MPQHREEAAARARLVLLGALAIPATPTVASVEGCAGWLTPARGVAAGELVECVFSRWGEPAEQIASECGTEVAEVLRVKKTAQKYGVSPKCGAP